MSRGVLYIVWGSDCDEMLRRSIASLHNNHPELPYEVKRLPASGDGFQMLLSKAEMMRFTPFDETLFLDADTVVLHKLDFGFEQALKHGLACAICESPWGRRYRGCQQADMIEYNTGVLFFSRQSQEIFQKWEEYSKVFNSTIDFVDAKGQRRHMPYNDQGSFAMAIANASKPPFVLPLNWNFRPKWQKSFFGPIKIWHDYSEPPKELVMLNDYYRQQDAVIQYHELRRG